MQNAEINTELEEIGRDFDASIKEDAYVNITGTGDFTQTGRLVNQTVGHSAQSISRGQTDNPIMANILNILIEFRQEVRRSLQDQDRRIENRLELLVSRDLPRAFTAMELRSSSRVRNHHAIHSTSTIDMLPRWNDTEVPSGPTTVESFWRMQTNVANRLLRYYDLSLDGTINEKRSRLARYLGIPPLQ